MARHVPAEAAQVLMDFLSSEERAALLDALSVSPSEYAAVYSAYREALQTNADPEKTAIFQAARLDAARGGREHAIARLNGFLDALNSQGKGTSENLCNWTEVGDPTLGAAAWIRQHPR
ncbi:MAG: hypothetical protein JNK04_12630 [Myxococcales bacterium]|nr:hypothetical protein [Myxococcales bacterium]